MSSLASQKLKFQLVFSISVVLVALLITWLILGDSSPFHNDFVWQSDLPDLWLTTTLLPFLFSAVLSGNPHSPPMVIYWFALIVQWFVFGYFLSMPISKIWLGPKRKSNKNKSDSCLRAFLVTDEGVHLPKRSSLCNLCVLCVSVVLLSDIHFHHGDTENTEVAQRRTLESYCIL